MSEGNFLVVQCLDLEISYWLRRAFSFLKVVALLLITSVSQVLVPLLVSEEEKTLVTCISCLTKVSICHVLIRMYLPCS